ncbi:DUF305 domain-containing protein [Terriglobus sp. RCC_193]|uniref:DUF305 domain-containing protein n=1 Tax=Terriglobus sp. RCC_193 TaxID=3239218 RepID=UPI0035264C65
MAVLSRVVGVLLCGCASLAFAQAPNIVQPGAPGKPTQELSAVTAAPPPKGPSDADVKFMQDMIMHHSQAIEMTELAKTRATNTDVKALSSKIDLSQGDEIRWMKQWLAERGYPEAPAGGMDHMAGMDHSQMAGMDHGSMAGMDHSQMSGMDHSAMNHDGAKKTDPLDVAMMPGMLTPRQMQALRAAHGAEFDRLFLTGMMQHHGGALLMVKELFQQPGAGQDPQLFDFANDVDNTQLAEIDIMKGILRKVNP